MNKADSNRIHAMRRLKERFGIDLTTRGYWELVRFILSGKAVFVPSRCAFDLARASNCQRTWRPAKHRFISSLTLWPHHLELPLPMILDRRDELRLEGPPRARVVVIGLRRW